jgi:elongation factor G
MEIAKKWRHDMVEKVAELDDALMEKYLTSSRSAWRRSRPPAQGHGRPRLLPGALRRALRNIGVQMLLDAVVDYLPSPTEKPEVEGTDPRDKEKKMTRPHDDNAPFSALVFKVVSDSTAT